MTQLAPFDISAEFKVARNFRGDGDIWLRDSLIDKARFSDRTLRMLYENHRIVALSGDEIEALEEARKAEAERLADKGKAPPPAGVSLVKQGVQQPHGALITPSADDMAEIAQLVASNSRADLVALASGIEGVEAKDNKGELAAKIVAARKAKLIAAASDQDDDPAS